MMFKKEVETMREAEMKELQLERLKWSLSHAYNNNKLYHDKFDGAGFNPDKFKSLEDMKHVPFLTKQEMRDAYPFGLFAVPLDKVVRIHSSSGTTGNATIGGLTKNDVAVFGEIVARSICACGGSEKDIIQVAFGYGLFTGGLGLHFGTETLGALSVPISGGNTERQLMLIKDFGTTIIACTPSYAINVADYIERNKPDYDMRSTNLRKAILGSEPWSERMREEIEKRLHIDAYDIYGLSEVMGPGVSAECTEKSGLHLCEDHFYAEIIDPQTGELLPEGSSGEIVYTSLTKEAFPTIRYRSKDLTRLYRDSCKCGRTLIKMERVSGRCDDMLIIRGVNVFPSQIEHVLMQVEGIAPHYQIILDRKTAMDDVEVMVEVSESGFSDKLTGLEALKKRLAEKLKNVLGVSMKVTLVEPMTIERSEGKAKRVIDKRIM
ncbi:MAG: phenylacetate--CoA ligase [Spirochaetia bacterium]|jgi:phenylacetate-CoA ligase|nr:phenylacetate--CoA ligase [Spirochaetia bacterium]